MALAMAVMVPDVGQFGLMLRKCDLAALHSRPGRWSSGKHWSRLHHVGRDAGGLHAVRRGLQRNTVCLCQAGITRLESSTNHEKLQVALDLVERACALCLSVRASMKKGEGQLDKVDHTPVTIADFGVQALISLELGKMFSGIPLIGEENASQLRADYEKKIASGSSKKALVESIVDLLATVPSPGLGKLDCETVLQAIDRGANALSMLTVDQLGQGSYWVLDPIDGTRGFLRGADALYVVGLALVENGKPVLGVMGCPNMAFHISQDNLVIRMASMYYKLEHSRIGERYQRGLVMGASLGGGCWVKPLTEIPGSIGMTIKSKVDKTDSVTEACFCISDNEVWLTSPLARALADQVEPKEQDFQVLPLCCGSLCKYFAVALGGASAFVLHACDSTPLKVWDHAAGVICVAEAGGQEEETLIEILEERRSFRHVVSDLDGTALKNIIGNGKQAFTVKGGGILASNYRLHSLLLKNICNQTTGIGQ